MDSLGNTLISGPDPAPLWERFGRRAEEASSPPAQRELDLKAAAKAAGEKSIQMLRQAELLPLTGYVHGGCSPLGMKKQLTTFLDASAQGLASVTVSAGRIGAQVELDPEVLCRLVRGRFAAVSKEPAS